jgi:hypothetical protein
MSTFFCGKLVWPLIWVLLYVLRCGFSLVRVPYPHGLLDEEEKRQERVKSYTRAVHDTRSRAARDTELKKETTAEDIQLR